MQVLTRCIAGEYAAGCPELVELLLAWGAQAEIVLGAAER